MKLWTVLLLLVLVARAGAVFVPPDETKSLFRRDALPVDTDAMRELSGQLTVIARRPQPDDPAQQRATAQLLAIASRLDPTNRPAREIARILARGDSPPSEDAAPLRRAKSRAWAATRWLLKGETGREGALLGNQLVDALHVIDPRHSNAKLHDPAGEAGRWKGVVASLAKFRPSVDPPTPKPDRPIPEPTPVPEPEPTPPPKPAVPVRLAESRLLTPLIVSSPEGFSGSKLVPLQLKVTPQENDGTLGIQLDPSPRDGMTGASLYQAQSTILGMTKRRWDGLPANQLATFHTGRNQIYSSRNGTALSGPGALLLNAAIAGQPLRDDVIFFGDIDTSGVLRPPKYAWEYLQILRTGPGGRLIVPVGLERHFDALVAIGEPFFFIQYEVLSVKTLGQALDLAIAGPGPESLAAASEDFMKIRAIATPGEIGPLAVNRHVRGRLAKIRQAVPNHLSAKMILLQGSGDRPTRLDTRVLAQELDRCLRLMDRFARSNSSDLRVGELETAFDDCRALLDPIGKYVARSDQKLHGEALAVVNTLRTLARLRKHKPVPSDESLLDPSKRPPVDPLRKPHSEFRARYLKLQQKLSAMTAAPAPGRKP